MFRTTLVLAVLCIVLALFALGTLLPSLQPLPTATAHLVVHPLISAVDLAAAAVDGGGGGQGGNGRIPPWIWCDVAGDRSPCQAPTGL